jgi:hypothetical protein
MNREQMAAWAVPNGINLGELTSQMGAAQPTSSAVTSPGPGAPRPGALRAAGYPWFSRARNHAGGGRAQAGAGLAEQGADGVLDVA